MTIACAGIIQEATRRCLSLLGLAFFVRAIILVCCDSLEDQAPRAPCVALPPDSEGPLPTDPQLIEAANRVVLDNFSPYPRWRPYEAACQKQVGE